MPEEHAFSTSVNNGKDVVFVENEDHHFLVYRWEGGNEIYFKSSSKEDNLAIRDILNNAYPVEESPKSIKLREREMEYHLKLALAKLKKLQNETTNVSIGNAMEAAGWFFKQDFQNVIDDLETALIIAKKQNDHVGERDH
ncbi:hypothetical protein P4H94_26730 [Paenibacillus macerans]|uniref:hypothetical protein n=1 Tax=Paenibacillus macerans TaxID=44252 RepID=UPI002DBE532C|nr:hypothetical protein [Paenibacillus macerans]MEC0140442.1 hypothetical protein [Paenibacillus macerans]